MKNLSRRAFLTTASLASSGLVFGGHGGATSPSGKPCRTAIGANRGRCSQTISHSDLVYDRPVARSEEGIPVGNGRMGSLVWTTLSQLRFQINRVDVYANNCATNSFFERHNDDRGGCAYLDIEFGGNRSRSRV